MQLANAILHKDRLILSGEWTSAGIDHYLHKQLSILPIPTYPIIIDVTKIEKLDTGGALLLLEMQQQLIDAGAKISAWYLPQHLQRWMALVSRTDTQKHKKKSQQSSYPYRVGRHSVNVLKEILVWLSFVGEIIISFVRVLFQPHRLKWGYFLKTLQNNGVNALPIIGFLSLLIGVVLTYQIGLQLKSYGANIYIVNLLGIAVLREFGPLITAIIMVGRTGSAFTAELGLMTANQEIDALKTLGISPVESLVLPKVLGLVFAMPLLVVWADIFGILGGMFMSNIALDINYYTFLQQFPQSVCLLSFVIGLIKAPVFAVIIAAMGCYHGLRVSGSAASVGMRTTKSVVIAISLIIIADAFFSVLLSTLKL